MKNEARFEAPQGWTAVFSVGLCLGRVWIYRTRGSSGVLTFQTTAEGAPLYHATHQNSQSNDSSLTTENRWAALHFAETGLEPDEVNLALERLSKRGLIAVIPGTYKPEHGPAYRLTKKGRRRGITAGPRVS
jgi:hypothetical protein